MRRASILLVLAVSTPVTARPTMAVISYTPTQHCTPFVGSARRVNGVQQQHADMLIDAFEKDYPAALVDPDRVESAVVSPATLKAIVADLACLATQPGGDPFVPDQAAALFASKRYGAQAFALLAKSGNARFAKQMRDYTAVRR